jgi:Rod binding domain-containing protein
MAAEHHHAVQRTITGIKISAKVTENATIAHLYLEETAPPSARRFEVKYVTKTNNAATIRYHAKDLNCPWTKTMAQRMRNTNISNTNPINLK